MGPWSCTVWYWTLLLHQFLVVITDHWAATCRCFSVRVDAVLLCITYIPHIPLLGFVVKVIFQLILVLFDMDLANPGKYDSLCYCFFIILYIGVGEFGVRGVTGEALSICSHNLLSSVGSQWFHILTTKQRTSHLHFKCNLFFLCQ